MRKKRAAVLVLAAAAILSGCSGKTALEATTSAGGETAKTEAAKADSGKAGDAVTISLVESPDKSGTNGCFTGNCGQI